MGRQRVKIRRKDKRERGGSRGVERMVGGTKRIYNR